MSVDIEALAATLKQELPAAQVQLRRNPGPAAQHSLWVAAGDLVAVALHLRDAHGFDQLTNLSGVDWPDPALAEKVAVAEGAAVAEGGFLEVVYHLYSTTRRVGPVVLRCRTADRADAVTLPSLVPVYRSADFQEREVYDLYGVHFSGHPDLRRILMWDEFVDHPMRKDYVAPDDYEYEPTPHDEVLQKASRHYPSSQS